jgi:hypothetical protein
MGKPGWKKDEGVTIWLYIYKSTPFSARSQGMQAKRAADKRPWQHVEIVHGANDAMAGEPLLLYECIDMSAEKGAITMCDEFKFEFTWDERRAAQALAYTWHEIL